MSSATMTVRLPQEEKAIITDFAAMLGMTVSELVRNSTMERIEDEIDARDYLEAVRNDDGVRYSMEEVMEHVRR